MTNFTDTVTIQGNLGVNADSAAMVPGAQVQVGDPFNNDSEGRIRVVSKTSGGNSTWEFGTSHAGPYGWGFAIRDVTSSPQERLHISLGTGNVGIGVISASEKLTVAGGNVQLQDTSNSAFRSISARFSLMVETPTSNQLMVGIRNQNSANYGSSVRFAYEGTTNSSANTDSRIEFWTMKNGADGGAERMRITAAGCVGIGTGAPVRALHLTRIGATEVQNGIQFSDDAANNYRTSIVPTFNSSQPSLNKLSLLVSDRTQTGQVTAMVLNGAGQVGIGTVNPQALLHVGDNAGAAKSGVIRVGTTDGGNGNRLWDFGTSYAGAWNFNFAVVDVAANRPVMTARYLTGNVGINTWNAAGQMDIKAADNQNETLNLLANPNNHIGALTIKHSTGVASTQLFADTSNSYSRLISRGSLGLHAGDTNFNFDGSKEVVTILTTGNVGIGAKNPQTMLQVGDQQAAADNVGLIRLASKVGGGARTWAIGPDVDSNMSFGIRDVSPGGPGLAMVVEFGSGNVGIGTTSTSAKLTVGGEIHATLPIRAQGAGENGKFYGTGFNIPVIGDVIGTDGRVYGAVYG